MPTLRSSASSVDSVGSTKSVASVQLQSPYGSVFAQTSTVFNAANCTMIESGKLRYKLKV